jgi:hypothetical protein
MTLYHEVGSSSVVRRVPRGCWGREFDSSLQRYILPHLFLKVAVSSVRGTRLSAHGAALSACGTARQPMRPPVSPWDPLVSLWGRPVGLWDPLLSPWDRPVSLCGCPVSPWGCPVNLWDCLSASLDPIVRFVRPAGGTPCHRVNTSQPKIWFIYRPHM